MLTNDFVDPIIEKIDEIATKGSGGRLASRPSVRTWFQNRNLERTFGHRTPRGGHVPQASPTSLQGDQDLTRSPQEWYDEIRRRIGGGAVSTVDPATLAEEPVPVLLGKAATDGMLLWISHLLYENNVARGRTPL